MANVPGYLTEIFADEYDYSEYTKTVTVDRTRDLYETTTMQGIPDRTYIAGLATGTITIDGLLDPAAGASDAQVDTLMDGSLHPVTVAWAGAGTIGNAAVVANVLQDAAPIGLPLDDVVTLSSGKMGTAAVTGGVILKDHAAETSTGNFTSVDNSASTAFGAVANLHVTAFSGTSATIKVTDSTDDAVFSDLITFTAVTGVVAERASATGTVNRYARVELTGTFTSLTFTVSFARLKQ